ncbi:MAG: hypothetical protein ACRD7E_22355 [Bryobacteraceae bacterium]
MQIRRQQTEAFEKAGVRNFEEGMVAHLNKFFPKHGKLLGEDQLRTVIKQGWQNANQHNLTAERSIRMYIELMCLLGSGFDQDPQTPWAADILQGNPMAPQAERIDRLYKQGWQHAASVSADYQDLLEGKRTERFVSALRAIRYERKEDLSPAEISDFSNRSILRLRLMFPSKCEYIGETCLRNLIQRGIEVAGQYGIASERGIVLFIVIMFVVGSGFDTDPQLPWASRVLTDDKIADQSAKVDQLYAESLKCLKQWWGIDTEQG